MPHAIGFNLKEVEYKRTIPDSMSTRPTPKMQEPAPEFRSDGTNSEPTRRLSDLILSSRIWLHQPQSPHYNPAQRRLRPQIRSFLLCQLKEMTVSSPTSFHSPTRSGSNQSAAQVRQKAQGILLHK